MSDINDFMDINIEQEFWGDFVQEAFEHLEDIETNVLHLEQNPEDMEIIHTMFRAFHTIKGLSGFVEHSLIQEIAHKTETMMDLCRKQILNVSKEIVDAILKSADYIKQLCEEVDSIKNENFVSEILKHVEVLESISDSVNEQKEDVVSEQNIESEPTVQSVEVIDDSFFGESSPDTLQVEEQIVEIEETEEQEQPLETESVQEEVVVTETFVEQVEVEEVVQPQISEAASNNIYEEPKKVENISNPAIEPTQEIIVKKTISAGEEYMKVANSKIDHLVDMIGELIINQALIEQHIDSKYSADHELVSEMGSFLGITRELQNLSMSLRMVSLKPTFQKISRIARDTISELNKNVEFVTSGETTEIDRVVTDKLLDPLVHLIKNAISHGVEEKEEDRLANNKSAKARVELNAYNKRGKIFIEVKDDGRGIDTKVVYQKALEKGLIDPAKNYTDEEIKEFIMLPGFSTAKVVDNISGRGVGMDVVKTQIIRIGGKVDIKSELNIGSTFTLEVPVNHAIMNGTVVEVQGQQFIIPTVNVKEILQPLPEQWISTQQRTTMLKVRENIIPIVPLSLLFKDYNNQENTRLVILLELDQELRALPINNVINRQEVVVKPVGPEFANLKYISGMSILGNGRVSLILDVDYLFKKEVKE